MFTAVWQPLEVILDSFLDMMDQGKVVAFPPNGRPPPEEGREEREGADPWVMESFSDADLRETLEEWERLVEVIEDRMSLAPTQRITYGCLNPDELENFTTFPKHGFARRFLTAMRRPRLQFIAPGLRAIGADAATQPFSGRDPVDDATIRPILLAHGEAGIAYDHWLPFLDAFGDTSDIPCGLYLTEILPDATYPWGVCRARSPGTSKAEFLLKRHQPHHSVDATFAPGPSALSAVSSII